MFDTLYGTVPPSGADVQDEPWLPGEIVDDGPTFDVPGPDEPLSEQRTGVPPAQPGYADTAPSGWLALELDSGTAGLAAMSDRALVEAVVGFDRISSWASARQARLLAELAHRADNPAPGADPVGLAPSLLADEVAVALGLGRGTAAARLHQAERLSAELSATHELWEAGRIDASKARAIHEATQVLSDTHARAVQERVLPRAPEQTLAQLHAALIRAILTVDPQGAADRHRNARRDRRVSLRHETEGMASLWALTTAPDAAAAFEWLTRLARGLGADDPRTIDERRVDLMMALLTGQLVTDADVTCTDQTDDTDGGDDPATDGPAVDADRSAEPGDAVGVTAADTARAGQAGARPRPRRAPVRPVTPGKPLIQIVMPYTTLLGADDQPAELAGYGPVPAGLAREIAADAVWHRLVTDPLSGALLDYGRTTYRPPVALADFVRARDHSCRGPLCRRSAAACELDHAVAWADGGTTSDANLHCLCTHHHRLKHAGRWRIDVHPDGRLTWITPTGTHHTTAAYDYSADPDPPPQAPPPAPYDPDLDPPPF